MIKREGDRMLVSGPLTLATVAGALREGSDVIAMGAREIDLGGVEELDSSALALLLGWLREAKRRDRSLSFVRMPAGLTTIAELYGVAGLLPSAPARHH
jgi:phospholipid transport system transporter-binding protein